MSLFFFAPKGGRAFFFSFFFCTAPQNTNSGFIDMINASERCPHYVSLCRNVFLGGGGLSGSHPGCDTRLRAAINSLLNASEHCGDICDDRYFCLAMLGNMKLPIILFYNTTILGSKMSSTHWPRGHLRCRMRSFYKPLSIEDRSWTPLHLTIIKYIKM